MLISPAFAQDAAAAAGQPSMLESIAPLILIMAVFYFLLIRPQQKKQKEHKQTLSTIRRGDRIVTGGGIIGTVDKVVNESELVVEIADKVKVRVDRNMVAGVLSKTEPAGDGESGGKDEGGAVKKGGGLKDLLSGKG